MKLTYNDIVSARMWAEAHCGEDDVLDVFQWKLLSLMHESHAGSSTYHERQRTECQSLMSEIESRFKVENADEF